MLIQNPKYKMEYYSDASMSESDEEEEELEPLYCQRELDYWEIEKLLDSRGPPPVIEYAAKLGVVRLRECAILPSQYKIEQVVDGKTVHSWNYFWQKKEIDATHLFSTEDWNAIGEFCLQLCVCCVPEPPACQVQSCMLDILKYGKFK